MMELVTPKASNEGDVISKSEDEMVLPWITRIGYGVGHFLNDLCSAMWFLFFLIFLTKVDSLSEQWGGVAIATGQIADAIATPVIGVWSDRGNLGCLSRIGRRKSWYLLGTVAVLITMPFMYSPAIGLTNVRQEWLTLYYCAFIVIFQFGWAAVQTVHLALATDLTPLESERTLLLSLRNTGTSIANFAVPTIFLTIQALTHHEKDILPQDSFQFQILVAVVLVIGTTCSIFAGFTMKESNIVDTENERLATEFTEPAERRTFAEIFSKFDFYKVALLYSSSRLFGNVLQTFVSLYVLDTLKLGSEHASAVPLSVYTAGTVASLVAERLIKLLGRKVTYVIGMIPGVIASVWIYLGPIYMSKVAFAYTVCSIYGAASSILVVTAISQTSVFIGMDIGNGAFVFGIMSLCDKLICGMAIIVITSLKPPEEYTLFYKDALGYTCGVSAIVGTIAILCIFLPSRTDASTPPEPAPQPSTVDWVE